MSKYTIDTDKVKETGEEIKKISADYNVIVNELYSKIDNMGNNGIWESESLEGMAAQFTNIVNKDKEKTVGLATSLNSLGDKVVDYSSSLSGCSDNKI